MIKKLFLSVVFFCFTLWVQAKDYADYVSPLVGTQSSFELSTGNTYPATARPWGMNFFSRCNISRTFGFYNTLINR